jgi:nucleoside-diphosphate-sugar epimerase
MDKSDAVRVLDDRFGGDSPLRELSGAAYGRQRAGEDAVRQGLTRCGVVFDLGAHRTIAVGREPAGHRAANVHAALTVLAAACDADLRRVVIASRAVCTEGAELVPTPEERTWCRAPPTSS